MLSFYNFQSLRDILQHCVPRGFFLFHQKSGKSRTVFQIPENKYSYVQTILTESANSIVTNKNHSAGIISMQGIFKKGHYKLCLFTTFSLKSHNFLAASISSACLVLVFATPQSE